MFYEPSESGSVIICTDPDLDPSINKQKSKENIDFYFLLLLFDILSLKTDVNVPWEKVIMKNTLKKNLFFAGILSATDEKTRIRIRKSVVRIRGSGRIRPKCHRSTTLEEPYVSSCVLLFIRLIYADTLYVCVDCIQ
jgi:hypothetical protein